MSPASLAMWIENTAVSRAVAESGWLFPALESLHVIALTLVVGSISIVDLRLLGLSSRHRPALEIAAAVLPLTWAGFGVAVVTGTLMFTAQPTHYLANPYFLGKFVLLGVAGVNMAAFQLLLAPRLGVAGGLGPPSIPVRLSAGLSLVIWISVVAFGRWIGFSV